jgi:hypothetical protein
MSENNQIPEIWETEEEKALSDQELKKRNFRWALKYLRGKSFVNKSINRAIAVSRDGLGEWKTVTKSREQAISIKILHNFLESAALWKEETPKNYDPNIEKVIYFKQECKINGNMYVAIITIKVYRSQKYYKYYHHYLDDFTITPKK